MSHRLNIFANLILVAIFISSVVAIIYAVHRSEFYQPEVMKKFYITFTIGISLCMFIMMLRPCYKVNIVLFMISIIFGIYLVEILLSFHSDINPTNLYAEAAKVRGIPFDARTRYQAYLDLVGAGADAYPRINVAQFLELDGLGNEGNKIFPFSGVSQKTTFVCNETGEYFIYQSDEHGFNNPPGLYNPGYIDIVFIGDSFTHGFCTAPGQDVAAQLRKTRKSIVNLGYGGNGPLTELAVLKEYGESLRPKILLWMYYEGNDLEDLAIEQQSPTLLNYLNTGYSQNLYNRQGEVDKALIQHLDEQIARFKKKGTEDAQLNLNIQLAQIIRLYRLRKILNGISSAPPPTPPPSPLFEKILKTAKERTSSWGGRLYFVYLPAWQRYGTAVDHGTLFHRDQVLSMIASLEIPIIDVHEAFSQHPDPLSLFPFRLPGHYVAEGYERVASKIKMYLEAKGVFAVIL